nr:capsule biosynthesis protein [Bacillota bacterium]
MVESRSGRLVLAATGDSLITQRLSCFTEPEFLRLRGILQSADVRFTNMEMLFHNFEGYPQALSGGTWVCAHPSIFRELQWMSFNLFAWANNHTLDWGEGGLFATLRTLEEAGAVHAGVGRNLAEARRPAYLETNAGRVALVAMCSTFHEFNRAGDSRPDVQGRPGLNPLRFETTVYVTAEQMRVLRQLDEELQLGARERLRVRLGFRPPDPEGTLTFLDRRFVVGEKPAVVTTPHQGDLEGNLRSIREARRQADWVLVSIHSHEMRGDDLERPAEFIETAARAFIDEGAHAVIGHGPHVLQGIEIYKGAPIFYSLGNFIFQNDTVRHQPADFYERLGLGPDATVADLFDARSQKDTRGFPADRRYWETVVPVCTWENGVLTRIELYPVELGFQKPRPARGRPYLAGPERAEAIIKHLAALSEPYGTTIRWDPKGFGVVELAGAR